MTDIDDVNFRAFGAATQRPSARPTGRDAADSPSEMMGASTDSLPAMQASLNGSVTHTPRNGDADVILTTPTKQQQPQSPLQPQQQGSIARRQSLRPPVVTFSDDDDAFAPSNGQRQLPLSGAAAAAVEPPLALRRNSGLDDTECSSGAATAAPAPATASSASTVVIVPPETTEPAAHAANLKAVVPEASVLAPPPPPVRVARDDTVLEHALDEDDAGFAVGDTAAVAASLKSQRPHERATAGLDASIVVAESSTSGASVVAAPTSAEERLPSAAESARGAKFIEAGDVQ